MGIIQELKTDTFITIFTQSGSIVETLDTLEPIDYMRVRFLIVKVIFPVVGIIAEQVERFAIHTDTNVIRSGVCSLGRCKEPAFAPYVANQTHSSGIMGG